MTGQRGARNALVELLLRRRLVRTNAARHDLGAIVVLTANGTAGHPPQHVDLSGMSQGVGNRALEKLLRRGAERKIGSQIVIEGPKRVEEPLHFLRPGQRS